MQPENSTKESVMAIRERTADDASFPDASRALLQAVEVAAPKMKSMSDADATRARAPGKWSCKQVLGHLIDSAANNHQRFVRAQEGPLTFPPYAQDHWVGCQHYQDRPWGALIEFWEAYNRHLAHIIRRIPDTQRDV